MPTLASIAQVLLIVGGLNWGLIGLFELDLVKSFFGGTVGTQTGASRLIYILVGLAAVASAFYLTTMFNSNTMGTARSDRRTNT